MDIKFTSRIANTYRYVNSKNVIAKYEGVDSLFKGDEYLLHSSLGPSWYGKKLKR
ncbi:MAG: hypothetical protein Ct9H90mP20_4330 [Candidatus Neomarinimicrobiota bacterium]|nr:MAG: hypothetical protein Ct9H90mP20_4330 [Candidatus Neomarinimicrobiota bacterium]